MRAYDPDQTQARYGVRGQIWRGTLNLDGGCDGSFKATYIEIDAPCCPLGYSQLGWAGYWCTVAGGQKCYAVKLKQFTNNTTRCYPSFDPPPYQAFAEYKISQAVIGNNPNYWQFWVDYNLSGQWTDLGHCLGDDDVGFVKGSTESWNGWAGFYTEEQVLKKRASGGTWDPWGSNACLENDTTGWDYIWTSDTSYKVNTGSGVC